MLRVLTDTLWNIDEHHEKINHRATFSADVSSIPSIFGSCRGFSYIKGLSTREAGRGHATPHMPVETAKCWWLLKIEPSLSLKPAQTPSKMGPKPLAKLYNSPKNSRAPTA